MAFALDSLIFHEAPLSTPLQSVTTQLDLSRSRTPRGAYNRSMTHAATDAMDLQWNPTLVVNKGSRRL